jgi:hypothetical protein
MSRSSFIGVGIVVLFCWSLWAIFFLMPVRNLVRVRSWEPESCEILESRVTTHDRRRSSRSFGIDVTYRWSRGGTSFTGDRYDFYGWHSTFSEDDWKEIVASLPPGARVRCFVNPRDPREAVIDREVHATQIGAWVLAWGMFAFGVVAIRISVRAYRRSRA